MIPVPACARHSVPAHAGISKCMKELRISVKAQKIAFVLLGLISVACLATLSWSAGLFLPKYHLEMYVSEADGIAVGAPVQLDGFRVGTVAEVHPTQISASPERRIELVLNVQKRYQDDIRNDSTATLLYQGLLGDRFVYIQRGFNGRRISPGGEIPAVPSAQFKFK